MELKIAPAGEAGLEILSRYYPDPRQSLVSAADVKKALAKIPVVFKGQDLRDKVLGYLATDRDTPVLGEYLLALKRIFNFRDLTLKDRKRMWNTDRDMAWRITDAPNLPRNEKYELERELLLKCVAAQLGTEIGDVQKLESRLRQAKSTEDLAACMMDWIPSPARAEGVDRT